MIRDRGKRHNLGDHRAPTRETMVSGILETMGGTRRSGARRRFRRAFPLLAVLLLCGCPYASDEPLSDPSSAAIDPSLLGTWRTRDSESEEWQSLVFLRFNDHEMVSFALGDSPDDVSLCRLFLTVIGGERFLNIRELESDDAPWYFARCTMEGDRCVLRFVDDGLFGSRAFGSAEDRREFVRTRLADPLLYAAEGREPSEMILERVRDAD
jgi:hypothetical protein